ncbi:Pectinesterase inhibitor [Corchorus capsularis]|uniref:Pectinesterase inhibitor n=1 Tax=Corchorus capsularis TaxID=210143 RepID=A0A1R3FV84_COCAP|nr:Pectinesterase inhibitor [Corchorus capsularis]
MGRYLRYYGHGVNLILIITIVTQITLLVFLVSSKSVEADKDDDKTIVRKLCSQSLEPEPCLDCILSDKGRGTSNISDLAYSIMFCMYSEETHAHDSADQLFQNTTEVGLKIAFEVCKDTLFSASNTLWDGLTKLEVSDYQNALVSARISQANLFQCVSAFRKYADVTIPSELVEHMVVAKRLYDVVRFMFYLI